MMDDAALFEAARSAMAWRGPHLVDLIGALSDAATPIPNSTWTARDIPVHLSLGHNLYAEMAAGAPSPMTVYEGKEKAGEMVAALHADVPETDPGKLAALMSESIERFQAGLEGRAASQPIVFHGGVTVTLAQMTATLLGETILHGYDLATAVGEPWPIGPVEAAVVLTGYLPIMRLWVNPSTAAEHSARYRLDLRGAGSLSVAFTKGHYSWGPAQDCADCVIDADPVAYLLAATGRVSPWPLIAMGLISAGGPRPELALGFGDLFVFP